MSNPFIEPGSLLSELERRRRERFKVGVYAVLGTATIFLAGMLIQGCKNQQQTLSDATSPSAVEQATNQSTNPTPTNVVAATSAPDTNAAAVPVPAAASTPSVPEPAASADSVAHGESVAPAPLSQPTTSETFYVVKRGDTLGRIAKAHGTTVKALKATNGLKSDQITAGRKLKLPQAHPTAITTAGN